jgi:hypothetical protein
MADLRVRSKCSSEVGHVSYFSIRHRLGRQLSAKLMEISVALFDGQISGHHAVDFFHGLYHVWVLAKDRPSSFALREVCRSSLGFNRPKGDGPHPT